MKEKDYAYRGWLLVFAVVVAMAGLSFVPSFKVFGLTTEKMDILSDLREKSEAEEELPAEFVPDFAGLDQKLEEATAETADSLEKVAPARYEWIIAPDSLPQPREIFSEQLEIKTNKHQTPIEDFDTTGVSRLDRFINKLISGDDVRVAFLGDSFIEGDIITVDMREKLQQIFGGRGVGFVPCDLPFGIYRTSVHRQASGWNTYSLLNSGSVPATYKSQFFMSGYLSVGHRGATVKWRSSDAKPLLDSCSRARVFITCRDTCSVELTVNDTLKHKVGISGASHVRELYVEAPVSSIKMQVLSGEVLCHGASLEGGRGIMVDNLSMRSNSGQTIFASSVATNKQIDKQFGYDLIVLEYGLNAMAPGQRNFSNYKKKLCNIIQYCQRCFPDAAILVLGVSDRAVKGEGGWRSINSVTYLGPVQRDAAKINGACFWDLGKVVMSYGGVNGFVSNGWAAGDHTHINFKGGARIAESLVQAIQLRAYEMLLIREGKANDIAYPIELEPWKAYSERVEVEDLTIPIVLVGDRPYIPVQRVEESAQPTVEPTVEPSQEEAKSEESKVEEPQKEQKTEEPKREEPKEEPKKEEPKAEPKREEPKKEEPKSEPAKSEEPKREAVAPTAAKSESAPTTSAAPAVAPASDAPKQSGESKPEVVVKEDVAPVAPSVTPVAESPKKEAIEAETPKSRRAKKEASENDAPKSKRAKRGEAAADSKLEEATK